ncbi:MAG: hypothetical protein K5840_07265 [Eubacterium sp.]|nr:hypothetical protein [Eubacterium sp.]
MVTIILTLIFIVALVHLFFWLLGFFIKLPFKVLDALLSSPLATIICLVIVAAFIYKYGLV